MIHINPLTYTQSVCLSASLLHLLVTSDTFLTDNTEEARVFIRRWRVHVVVTGAEVMIERRGEGKGDGRERQVWKEEKTD